MAFPHIAAFARSADGGAAPERSIAGQPTLLSRAEHDIVYDEVNDEIVIANTFAQAILTFRGGADGEEEPIRVIQGPSTQMQHPDYGVAVDAVHNELFVAERGYILVFSRTANGDAVPIRVIRGPDTRLTTSAMGLRVDPVRNLLVAAAEEGLLIFNRTDNGNVKPRAVIGGPKTGIRRIIYFEIYPPKGWVIAVTGGSGGGEERGGEESPGSRGGEGSSGQGSPRGIAVWSINDKGDIPPLWLLGGPKSGVQGNRVVLNPKLKEVIIGGLAQIQTYSFPEIF